MSSLRASRREFCANARSFGRRVVGREDVTEVSTTPGTGEGHYDKRMDLVRKRGIERLGIATAWAWHDDPRHVLFTLSRYKFVAKMLAGRERVLDRKSTRLNSSHEWISYAVFCLKKKTLNQ